MNPAAILRVGLSMFPRGEAPLPGVFRFPWPVPLAPELATPSLCACVRRAVVRVRPMGRHQEGLAAVGTSALEEFFATDHVAPPPLPQVVLVPAHGGRLDQSPAGVMDAH